MTNLSSRLAGLLILLGLLSVSRPASAQLPEPFATIPGDSVMLIRVDLQAAMANPRLAPIIKAVQERDPDFPESMLFSKDPSGGDSLAFLAKDFPGDVRIIEAGMAELPSDPSAMQQAKGYSVLYGQMNPDAIMKQFTAAGWAQQSSATGQMVLADPKGAMFMTMPNEWTMIMAPGLPQIERQLATAAGQTPSAKAMGPLSSFATAAPGSLAFLAVQVPAAQRQQMAAMAAQPDPSMAMFPGMIQLMQELPRLQTVGAILRDADGMKLQVALNFEDEATSTRAAAALNMAWPAMMGMARMMAAQQNDPAQLAKIDQMMALKFASNGPNTSIAIPIPDEDLAKMVEAIQQLPAGGPAALMAPPGMAPPPAAP